MPIMVPEHANEELNRQFLSAVAEANRAQRHARSAIAAANRAENVLEAMRTLMVLLRRAEGNLAEVGNSLAEDGGPLRKELHTELDWLMEDAIGLMKLCSQEDDDIWKPAKWDQIASELSGADVDDQVGQVKLRISLLQLGTIHHHHRDKKFLNFRNGKNI